MYQDIKEKINESDMVLIGMGEELLSDSNEKELIENFNKLSIMLEHDNYFVVATFDNECLRKSQLNQKRIVYPYKAENDELEGKQWDLYNKWLSATLAKRLLLLEVGEGFRNPNVIRWPFERVTMINNTAYLYRIHSEFAQIPAELQEKSKSINKNASVFLKEFVNDCE